MHRVEAVVPVEIFQRVVDDKKQLLADLRDVVQAHVDAGGFTDVVVLDEVDPGQGGGEHVIDARRDQPGGEVTFGQFYIGDVETCVGAEFG